jgi:hypothetical protein
VHFLELCKGGNNCSCLLGFLKVARKLEGILVSYRLAGVLRGKCAALNKLCKVRGMALSAALKVYMTLGVFSREREGRGYRYYYSKKQQ